MGLSDSPSRLATRLDASPLAERLPSSQSQHPKALQVRLQRGRMAISGLQSIKATRSGVSRPMGLSPNLRCRYRREPLEKSQRGRTAISGSQRITRSGVSRPMGLSQSSLCQYPKATHPQLQPGQMAISGSQKVMVTKSGASLLAEWLLSSHFQYPKTYSRLRLGQMVLSGLQVSMSAIRTQAISDASSSPISFLQVFIRFPTIVMKRMGTHSKWVRQLSL